MTWPTLPRPRLRAAACLAALAALPCFADPGGTALPEPRTTAVFGERIQYYDVGSGPAVVLLHGLGSSAKGDWGGCMMALARHHRVLAPDQLGFGGSDKPIVDYNVQIWVDFLGEFLREAKVRDFALAGESLGGWVAALYAIEASSEPPVGPSFVLPKPVRLVLSDAAGHRRLAERLLAGGPEDNSLAGAKAILAEVFHGPSWRTDEAIRGEMAWSMAKGDGWTRHSFETNRAILGEAVDGRLGAIRIPTLVVWGAEDGVVPLEDGKDFAARIAGARLVVIPDCGHAPPIEAPAAFEAEVLPFLN